MVPLLVRAQTEDADGGDSYTRRLLTIACAALAVATLVAMAAAPLLTRLYLGDGAGPANPQLATAFAWLLLPQIFFYGVGALLGAMLNTRGVFGPFAWAPVLNNVVVLAVLGVFVAVPGRISLDPVQLSDPKLLVLGVGTTLGIVVQALVMIPAVHRTGFRYRPMWGWDRRLAETGGLAVWVVGYVLIGQAGYIVTTRVAAGAAPGSVAIYSNAWLLLQVPYGVLGVSLLTALMPRMSRAAARGDREGLLSDLSLGSRLSALALLPVTALFIVLGPAIGTVIYGHGRTDASAARTIGEVLAVSAFGLVPFAITMLQLRVFYAVKDARTPSMINLGMTVARVALSLLAALVLADQNLVAGLLVATSLSYVVGAIVGEVLLHRRFGRLDTARTIRASVRFLVMSVLAGLAAWLVLVLVTDALGAGFVGSLVAIVLASLAAGGVLVLTAVLGRSAELDDVLRGLRGRPAAEPTGRHRAGRE
jgi:putative peptidoglycan lipid II flippase